MTIDPEKLVEVEHENLRLSQEIIEMYKKKVGELEIENRELRNQLNARGILVENIKFPKPRVRTINELIHALELRSIPSKEQGHE